MTIGITGGTGFMGTHLARRLTDDGQQVVLVSRSSDGLPPGIRDRDGVRFLSASVTDRDALRDAFVDCDRIAHLAGINIERADQTYEAVHVRGTENVLEAATRAGVSKVLLSSFLKARPNCGSPYHESKWAAEELVRRSDLAHTIVKAGITYGRWDQMVWNLSRSLSTAPIFGLLGRTERRLRPLAIDDLVDVMAASLVENRLRDSTVAVVGPEELTLEEAVRRVGDVLDRNPLMIPLPVRFHYVLARLQERVVETPLTTTAQVRMLAEGLCDPAPEDVCDPLPAELEPSRPFSTERIANAVTDTRPYGLADLRV